MREREKDRLRNKPSTRKTIQKRFRREGNNEVHFHLPRLVLFQGFQVDGFKYQEGNKTKKEGEEKMKKKELLHAKNND